MVSRSLSSTWCKARRHRFRTGNSIDEVGLDLSFGSLGIGLWPSLCLLRVIIGIGYAF